MNNYDKDIRTRVNEALIKYSIKQVDLAKETNVHHSTLSLWLQGKVKGTQIKIEEQMERWLHNILSVSKNKAFGSKPLYRLQLLKAKREKPNFDKIVDNKGFGHLIPININVELEGKKFKEIFFWDYFEPYLQPEQFVKIMLDDNNLPITFESEILNQLTRQISQYNPNEIYFEGEIIKTIKLDIRLEDKLVTDQFDWDINNPNNRPEEFSECYCKDLCLDTEFLLPIAHSIKEQILEHRKNIMNDRNYMYQMMVNNRSNNNIEKQDAYNLTYLRDTINIETEYQPTLRTISQMEILKYEQKEERKSRYAQRKK